MYKLNLKQKKGNEITDLVLNVPESWYEVTVKQYIDIENLEDKTDILAFISILTGVEKKLIGDITSNKVVTNFRNLVSFILGEKVDWKKIIKDVPKTIKIKGKELKVKGFGKFTLGQRIVFEQILWEKQPKKDEDLIELIPACCAIAFFPEYYGRSFDKSELDKFTEIINDEPIVKMISPAYFFLIILMSLTASGAISSSLQSTRTLIGNLLKSRAKPNAGKNLVISV